MSPSPDVDTHGYVEQDENNIYYWNVARLWELADGLPIELVDLEQFDWTNENFQYESSEQPLSWRTIGDETKRIFEADIQYPVILSAEGNVMDGMHRILKCYAFDMPSVPAVRFSETPEPDKTTPRADVKPS